MAIAFDAAAGGSRFNSSGSSTSWSHTTSGSDRILVVSISSFRSSGGGDVITGITYNGVSMTLVGKDAVQSNIHYYLYYLINPATGTNTITVSHATTNYLWGTSSSYTGVDQTTPIDSSTIDTAGTVARATTTATTTVVGSNCWLVGGCHSEGVVSSVGAGTTLRADDTADNRHGIADSNGTVSTGSQSLIFNHLSTQNTSWGIISLAPAGGGGGPTYNALAFCPF